MMNDRNNESLWRNTRKEISTFVYALVAYWELRLEVFSLRSLLVGVTLGWSNKAILLNVALVLGDWASVDDLARS